MIGLGDGDEDRPHASSDPWRVAVRAHSPCTTTSSKLGKALGISALSTFGESRPSLFGWTQESRTNRFDVLKAFGGMSPLERSDDSYAVLTNENNKTDSTNTIE